MQSQIQIENISTENFDGKILFVLKCQIIAGDVKVGYNMNLPFSTGFDMTIPIDEIEVIGVQRIKIKVNCEDQEEIDFLLGLNLDGEVLLVDQ